MVGRILKWPPRFLPLMLHALYNSLLSNVDGTYEYNGIITPMVTLYKTLFYQTAVRDSPAGPEEVNCHISRGPVREPCGKE